MIRRSKRWARFAPVLSSVLLVLGVYPPVFTSDLNYMVSLLIPKSFVQLIILLFAAESMWQVVACQLLFSAHEAIYLHMHLPEHLDLINFGLYTLFIWLMIFIFATRFFNLKRYFFLMFWKLKTIKKEYDDVLGDFPEGILIALIEEIEQKRSKKALKEQDALNSFFNISITHYLNKLKRKFRSEIVFINSAMKGFL